MGAIFDCDADNLRERGDGGLVGWVARGERMVSRQGTGERGDGFK